MFIFFFQTASESKSLIPEPATEEMTPPSQLPIRQASTPGSFGQAEACRANCASSDFWGQLASKLSLKWTYSTGIDSPEFGCLHSWGFKTVCLLTFSCPQVSYSCSLLPWPHLLQCCPYEELSVLLPHGHLTVICTSVPLEEFRLYVTSKVDGLHCQITFLQYLFLKY